MTRWTQSNSFDAVRSPRLLTRDKIALPPHTVVHTYWVNNTWLAVYRVPTCTLYTARPRATQRLNASRYNLKSIARAPTGNSKPRKQAHMASCRTSTLPVATKALSSSPQLDISFYFLVTRWPDSRRRNRPLSRYHGFISSAVCNIQSSYNQRNPRAIERDTRKAGNLTAQRT